MENTESPVGHCELNTGCGFPLCPGGQAIPGGLSESSLFLGEVEVCPGLISPGQRCPVPHLAFPTCWGDSTDVEDIVLRQAGTWDPLLQYLNLDEHLLVQQNTKKLYGTKNNCVQVHLGQIMDKMIQND